MRSHQKTVWEGEDVGPVDWSHDLARDMPEIWREAERRPNDFVLSEDFSAREIYKLCMYDGWPYWKPMPALLVSSPMGGCEWKHFNSYGIRPSSIRRKAPTQESPHEQG